MDLTLLKEAIASKSYDQVADICDELELQFAARGVNYQNEWPYAIHLLGHIYVQDINNARFIWKRTPSAIKESQPEVVAVWKIGQCLWTHDYAGVHDAIRGFDWSAEVKDLVSAFSESYTKRMFDLLSSAYSTITVADVTKFLGLSEEGVTNYALQHGWTIDPESKMLTVRKMPKVVQQKLDPSKLQNLTEYVFHLEH
ncbi:hypothetical protein AMTRI_Chr11g99280 [Amborella trichopoda]|uniref:CSN8/PSMD8/EIF3K domain-containing protein n=1 Tax=Amborella trichopoda TaxID=13333 RepID=W1PM22_AMBTC|nr:COP9 signalosome complex subunit 8 [Amborella trichopoda]XP_011624364.1 COP9 signalosome complex subunit 8 [Amborella trichopoda]ERN08721.1 hypothetical protein AMTR_s00017p00237140 [Amborella trichopoda]|eukprot:XP_006847140.1 COP9 signalosome complex subunit 8 [Amborella trichopoda]